MIDVRPLPAPKESFGSTNEIRPLKIRPMKQNRQLLLDLLLVLLSWDSFTGSSLWMTNLMLHLQATTNTRHHHHLQLLMLELKLLLLQMLELMLEEKLMQGLGEARRLQVMKGPQSKLI